MRKPFPDETNCWTASPHQLVYTPGIPLEKLSSGKDGVRLANRSSARLGVPLGDTCPSAPVHDGLWKTVFVAWHTEHNVLCGVDDASPRQVLVRIGNVMSAEIIRGSRDVETALAARQEILSGRHQTFRPANPTCAVFCLSYGDPLPIDSQPEDATVLRVETKGRPPFVIELTAHERNKFGQPLLFIKDLKAYTRAAREQQRSFEHGLLGWVPKHKQRH